MGSFGGTIPVVGMYNGYPGTVSRAGVNKIKARQVLSTTPSNINFGETAVLVPDSLGGTWQSVKDFIAGGGAFIASKLAGFACREVKTNLSYSAASPGSVGGSGVAYYAPGEMAEVIELASGLTVQVNNGAPVAGNPVFVRTVLNGSIPAGVVGGIEAVNDNAVNTTASAASTNSTTLSVSSATGIAIGQAISGVGIPANTVVTNVVGTTLTLSNPATVASGAALNFANTTQVPNVVFTTGVLDGNGVAEIAILNRQAA